MARSCRRAGEATLPRWHTDERVCQARWSGAVCGPLTSFPPSRCGGKRFGTRFCTVLSCRARRPASMRGHRSLSLRVRVVPLAGAAGFGPRDLVFGAWFLGFPRGSPGRRRPARESGWFGGSLVFLRLLRGWDHGLASRRRRGRVAPRRVWWPGAWHPWGKPTVVVAFTPEPSSERTHRGREWSIIAVISS